MTTGTAQPSAQAPYEFTSDWFSGHIPVWKQVIAQVSPKKILEIGCYEGRATTWLIEHCGKTVGLELHCVDPWSEYADLPGQKMSDNEARFDKNVALARKNNPGVSVVKHKKKSVQALAEFIAGGKQGSFDMVYIDGSHHAPDVLSDAVMSFPLLRKGGIMIFDDYLWHLEALGAQNPLTMPKPAIDAFLNIFLRKVQIVGGTPLAQIYVLKIAE